MAMITIDQILSLETYLRGCCGKITKDQSEIDDAIQDTFLWICEQQRKRGLDFLDYNGEPNTYYLRMLAVHKLLYARRCDKKRKERELESELQTEAGYVEPEKPEPYLCAAQLVQAINEEEPYERELLKLVYFGKQKQKDIARALDIPYQTIIYDIKKARERIKAKVEYDTKAHYSES